MKYMSLFFATYVAIYIRCLVDREPTRVVQNPFRQDSMILDDFLANVTKLFVSE